MRDLTRLVRDPNLDGTPVQYIESHGGKVGQSGVLVPPLASGMTIGCGFRYMNLLFSVKIKEKKFFSFRIE